ncbi:MAG TPA: L-threonylcarbamoyladenylate synthase [Fimbriimonadales bacterium]|jgi:L-threonylcarbamoyladenylate synthase|nr:L-threonylcarbamoyladenylate synthase [Fimbriimonadales bacterium]
MKWFRPTGPGDPRLSLVAAALLEGKICIVPTETVYGIAALASDEQAIRRVYEAKGRPNEKGLIVAAATVEQARRLCSNWPTSAQRLADRFWPGPLTIVLPKVAGVCEDITGGGPTVAVRVPDHPILLEIIGRIGEPVIATSANVSGQASPRTAEYAIRQVGSFCAYAVDNGPSPIGTESTIVSLVPEFRVLREGAISARQIEDELALRRQD